MNSGSVAAFKIAIVALGAAFGGAVAFGATVLTTHPRPAMVHQRPAIVITPAPDHYLPVVARAPVIAPVRLAIPALHVDAGIESLGITQDFSVEAPSGISNVGWYGLGSAPGAPGDAILDGHRGYPGGIPAVFNSLDRLHQGDEVDVNFADGHSVKFAVTRVYSTPYQSIPAGFFALDGPPKLTLVTCTGDFDSHQLTYSNRLVVEAEPVG
ncbi:MAG: hypothetical protein NVS9B1_08620 [Candidatus Dormibacteraceae bacterium]